MMKFLILNRQYNEHISFLYKQIPELADLPFEKQVMDAFTDTGFMFAGVYEKNLKMLGYEAFDFPVNNRFLLLKWAVENGLSIKPSHGLTYDFERLLKYITYKLNTGYIYLDSWFRFTYEVIRRFCKIYKPDIIYVIEDNILFDSFIKELKANCLLICAQVGSSIRHPKTCRYYDAIFTCMKNKVAFYRQKGIKTFYLPLGFEASYIKQLPVLPKQEKVIFIGSIVYKEHHARRTRLLEQLLIRGVPIDVYGFFSGYYPKNGILRKFLKKEVWGFDLFRERMQAAVNLNFFPSYSDGYATNVGMFETTGVGSLLLTEEAIDLKDFFDLETEALAFKTLDEAVEKISFCLSHISYTEQMSRKGQLRTLKEHNYFNRTKELVSILEKNFLWQN